MKNRDRSGEINTEFRVIIAGSRSFDDYDLLCRKCDRFFSARKPTAILCGEARGADLLGKRYAAEHGIPVRSYPADWNTHGRKAGYLRNLDMAENADALIACWDGQSRGTSNMIHLAYERGLSIRIIRFGDQEGNC